MVPRHKHNLPGPSASPPAPEPRVANGKRGRLHYSGHTVTHLGCGEVAQMLRDESTELRYR